LLSLPDNRDSHIAPIMMIKQLFTMRGNIEPPGLMKSSFATINNSVTWCYYPI